MAFFEVGFFVVGFFWGTAFCRGFSPSLKDALVPFVCLIVSVNTSREGELDTAVLQRVHKDSSRGQTSTLLHRNHGLYDHFISEYVGSAFFGGLLGGCWCCGGVKHDERMVDCYTFIPFRSRTSLSLPPLLTLSLVYSIRIFLPV